MRKVDLRVLPLLGMLYSLAVIDRSNLGIARVVGMDEDLGLSIGSRYSIVTLVYFFPYIFFQLPSNILLRIVGVRNWLTFCVIGWGTVELSMGFSSNWGMLALCRTLLGALEAGFFPALVFIISTWYKRHEVQKRIGAFYIVSIVAGGFSAILAYAIGLLGGKLGLSGWSWIMIIEGGVTMLLGLVTWFFIPGFPDGNDFLDPHETAFVLERIEKDRGDSLSDSLSMRKALEHMMDWTIWAYGIMFMCSTVSAYGLSYFITLILRGMGWSVAASLLLSAPPYIFAAVTIMFFSWLSDKYRHRAIFIAIQTIIGIAGWVLTGYCPRASWRYIGLFLSNAGSAGCIPGILAYSSNNIISHSKRAVTTAVTISVGGIGGIMASVIFREQDAPRYLPGIIVTIGLQVLLLIILALMTLHFWRRNTEVSQGLRDPLERRHGFLYTL